MASDRDITAGDRPDKSAIKEGEAFGLFLAPSERQGLSIAGLRLSRLISDLWPLAYMLLQMLSQKWLTPPARRVLKAEEMKVEWPSEGECGSRLTPKVQNIGFGVKWICLSVGLLCGL